MTFDSDVSERDAGVKVVDFQIRTQGPENVASLVSKLEKLVAQLKGLAVDKPAHAEASVVVQFPTTAAGS